MDAACSPHSTQWLVKGKHVAFSWVPPLDANLYDGSSTSLHLNHQLGLTADVSEGFVEVKREAFSRLNKRGTIDRRHKPIIERGISTGEGLERFRINRHGRAIRVIVENNNTMVSSAAGRIKIALRSTR